MRWPAWPQAPVPSKKFQVKVKPMKLEGFKGCEAEEEIGGDKVVMVEMKWKGPKAGLVALPRSSKQIRNVSAKKIVKRGEVIEWDDEFEGVCCLTVSQNDNPFKPWDVSFKILYGKNTEARKKLTVIGTVTLNISELAGQREPQIERKLPITLQFEEISSEATLLISVSFIEMRDSQESQGVVQEGPEAEKEDGSFRKAKDLTKDKSKNKKKHKEKKSQDSQGPDAGDETGLITSSCDTDESTTFDSEGSPDTELGSIQKQLASDKSSIASVTEGLTGATEDGSTSVYYDNSIESKASHMTQANPKVGFFSWRKRRLSFGLMKTKEEPLLKKKNGCNEEHAGDSDLRPPSSLSDESVPEAKVESSNLDFKAEGFNGVSNWEEKEFCSRDGQVKLKTKVFFASIDQRSEKAAGEGACTVLVAVIADWLQSHREVMPTRSELDRLITEGSLEWRKLCDNEEYLQCFPDRHFDLETVLQAELRPLSVMPHKSFIGFFGPESFDSLKGAMSFDGIWDEITSNVENGETKQVYIVSWNDHFFVLKVEGDAFYIIDTLGERLFEGCDKAYMLKFDDTSSIYRLPDTETNRNGEEDATVKSESPQKESEELICKGKECCKEFIKRFLAAIPLRELELEEKKGTVSTISLHQRLQIEFHYSLSSSSSSDEG